MSDRYRFDDVGFPEREQASEEIHRDRSEERFIAIRHVLEDAGIPFPRANELAERAFKALKEIG